MSSSADTVQRSRTAPSTTLAPNTFGDNKYHPTHSYRTLQRMVSLPEIYTDSSRLHSSYIGPPHRPSPFRKPLRDWDLWDDYWADRRYFMSPLAWPNDHSRTNKRYDFVDPPYGLWWNYPALPWFPHHGSRQIDLMERIDPLYSRRFRDPSYDKPIWKPARNWPHETGYRMEPRRILQMYQQKLIDYDVLQKNWLTPFSLQRKIGEYQRESKEQEQEKAKLSMIRAASVGKHGTGR